MWLAREEGAKFWLSVMNELRSRGVRLRAEQTVARVDALRAVGEMPLRDHLADGRESAD